MIGQISFQTNVGTDAAAGIGAGMVIFWLVVCILSIAGMWKVFTKAGKPGWAAIVPIYNWVVMLEIVGKPVWWIAIILFVPFVNIIFAIIVLVELAKVFGKGGGFVVGLLLLAPIFICILGFGSARYLGTGAGTVVPPVQTGASNYTTPPKQL